MGIILPPESFDWRIKGLPATWRGDAEALAGAGLSVLNEDLMLPAAVLRRSALEHNSGWMKRFTERTGTQIAPHGKTTMSPELFAMQMADGAWGITAATPCHVRAYRAFGIDTIFMANQLVGRENIAYVAAELRDNPGLDFYCLVDSMRAIDLLEAGLSATPAGRRLQVLIELGIPGGRTGFRDNAEALAAAERIAASPHVCLRGIEAFEGIIQSLEVAERDAKVDALLQRIVRLGEHCHDAGLFSGEPILSAGGSALFDRVAETFGAARKERPFLVLLRSGCYLVHDSHFYRQLIDQMEARSPIAASLGDGLRPALEVWAYVHSRPEPTRVIAGLGKRDIGEDVARPMLLAWVRPGPGAAPLPVDDTHRVMRLDDQHAYIDVPADSPLQPGDMIALGISHPCTTFDKWKLLYIVDDALVVTGSVRTYF
ncbi:alanine racemase [Sphingosinicella soli]|uniref:D-serine dehydratase n=1 Tax=Sphingosinicella soli TaxID=333708 RepID=A0A7W7B136_9SPHN|nr:alanine racemase [Sphingosinicella soli]MBB4631035.1 D-serine dehydratase [Sphingosinicella soli]